MQFTFEFGCKTPKVCRLGLATRGNTHLEPDDVHSAVAQGINYLNWCGHPNGLSKAVAEMGPDRKKIVLAWQLQYTKADEAGRELDFALEKMKTDYIDIVTFYYVERESEWYNIASQEGAYALLSKAQEQGKVRLIGLTSHQRKMAVQIAAGDIRSDSQTTPCPLDMLMLRYNAAHRGAEKDVFPVTDFLHIPVVVYTCLRWGALLETTPSDPPGYIPPPPTEWYRFALANPSVAVAISAPNDRKELNQNLELLSDWRPPTKKEQTALIQHGDRVYQHAGGFP